MPRPPRAAVFSPRLILMLAAAFGIAGCGSDSPTELPAAPDRVQVTLPAQTLVFGESTTAAASVLDTDGAPIANSSVTWSSSDPDVASVEENGDVTAVGVGTATIRATAGAVSGTANVEVEQAEWVLSPRSAPVPIWSIMFADLPAPLPLDGTDTTWAVPAGADTVFLAQENDSVLTALMPDIGAGAHSLEFELSANARVILNVTTEAAPVVADPDAAIEGYLAAIEDVADSLVAELATMDASLGHDEASAAQLLVDDVRTAIAGMGDADKADLASFLAANPSLLEPWTTGAAGPVRAPLAAGSLTWNEVRRPIAAFLISVVAADASIQAVAAAWRTCKARPWLRIGCGLAVGVPAAALVVSTVTANISVDAVLNTIFKPYEEMVAEVDASGAPIRASSAEDGATAPALAAAGSAGPFELYSGYPLDLNVTQTFSTLEPGDRDETTGDVGAFLYALEDFRGYWTEVRLLIEQIARDLGRDLSLEGAVAAFQDPPQTETFQVPRDSLAVRSVSNASVSCETGSGTALRLTCTTEADTAQAFTVTLAYNTDFGLHSLEVEGVLDPGAPPFNVTRTDLGTLGGDEAWAKLVDDDGRIFGTSNLEPGVRERHLFSWQNGTMQNLGTPVPGDWYGVSLEGGNDIGVLLTDMVSDGTFLWQDGAWQGPLSDSLGGVIAIDNQGRILARSWLPFDDPHMAVVWDHGTVTRVGPAGVDLWAYDMNNVGQVVGTIVRDGVERPYVWTNGTLEEIPVPEGMDKAYAFGINDAGQVIGAWGEEGTTVLFGWVWQDGELTYLDMPPEAYRVAPRLINEQGHIVGEVGYAYNQGRSLFYWVDGAMYTFENIRDGTSMNRYLYDANEQGMIVGHYAGRAVLWTVDLGLIGAN